MKSKRRSVYRRRDKKRRPWSRKEDEAIKHLVQSIGTKQWTLVADKLLAQFNIPGRTGKQCRERWHNHLESGITKAPWSLDEELTLFRLQSFIGNKWAEISNSIPGRTDNSVKNHFYSTLRKQYRKIYGVDPTREQLHQSDKLLAGEVLLTLTQKASDKFFMNNLEFSMPIDDRELVVSGHQIPLPSPECCFLEQEFPVEFRWEDKDILATEVFVLPFAEEYETLNMGINHFSY